MKKLMIVGTGSSVGKSLITAGLCRILSDKGFSVTPFKSQNMSLNAYVTDENLEMGIAQVIQARAGRTKESVHMNPILLKPNSDFGSQIILQGKIYKTLKARDYFSEKEKLIPFILNSYEQLSQKFEYMIIEGAGSPAEINLRSVDIVNMGLAQMLDSDVIMVGDVDRGGVFAALYGTYHLLSVEDQKRIKGFIINKFRGDVSLLYSGVREIEKRLSIPCLGILPMINSLHLDDEDSLSDNISKYLMKSKKMLSRFDSSKLSIGVLKLASISNSSDFSVLFKEDINFAFIEPDSDIDCLEFDMIIIPGSKNTISDFKNLFDLGFDSKLIKFHQEKGVLFGICGGFQILGQSIIDDKNIESSAIKELKTLSLIPTKTVFKDTKTTNLYQGTLDFQGKTYTISGYEIHLGQTYFEGKHITHYMDEKANLYGTYIHDIFSNDLFRQDFLEHLAKARGKSYKREHIVISEIFEEEITKLAQTMTNHLEIEKIIKLMR